MKIRNILIIILLLALVLRVYGLGDQSIWIDEGFSSYATKNIIEKGIPLMDSGREYNSYSAFHYPLAAFAITFGFSDVVLRFYSVIFGLLMIYLAFILGKEFFGSNRIGLFAAIIIAFSIWEIGWSRQIRSYQQLQFFFFLSLLFMKRLFDKPNFKYALLFLVSSYITILTHPFGYSLIGIFIIMFLFYLIFERKKFISRIKQLLVEKNISKTSKILLSIITFGLLAFLLFISANLFLKLNPNGLNYATKYFLFLKSDYRMLFYLGIIGFFLSLQNYKKTLFITLAFIIPYIFITNYVYLIQFRYLFLLFPVLTLFTSVIIDRILELKTKRFNLILQIILLGIIFLTIFSSGFVLIPEKTVFLERETPQPNFKGAYEFILENDSNNSTLIAANTVPAILYYKNPDFWLRYSLTGKPINYTSDVYTGSPAIINLNNITSINSSYYLVIDQLGMNRINPEVREYINNNLSLEWSDASNYWSKIWVFKNT